MTEPPTMKYLALHYGLPLVLSVIASILSAEGHLRYKQSCSEQCCGGNCCKCDRHPILPWRETHEFKEVRNDLDNLYAGFFALSEHKHDTVSCACPKECKSCPCKPHKDCDCSKKCPVKCDGCCKGKDCCKDGCKKCASATLKVTCPAGATIYVDDFKSQQTGSHRTYYSAPFCGHGCYTVRCIQCWPESKKCKWSDKHVCVKPSETVEVHFDKDCQ